MSQLFSNAGRGELAATINSTDTTITIVAGGDAYPVANTGAVAIGPAADWFKCVLQDTAGIEIVYVRTHTAASLSFTNVLRGQEGTTARGFTSAVTVFGMRVTAADHTAYVTKTGSETLTNKTLTAPLLDTPTSGNLSNCTVDGTNSIGFRHIPQLDKTANYPLVLDDAGKHVHKGGTTALTVTIPANASVAFPIGTAITFVNSAASGLMTIVITSDTMRLAPAGTTGSRSLAAYGVATAIKVTSTLWMISGSGLT